METLPVIEAMLGSRTLAGPVPRMSDGSDAVGWQPSPSISSILKKQQYLYPKGLISKSKWCLDEGI